MRWRVCSRWRHAGLGCKDESEGGYTPARDGMNLGLQYVDRRHLNWPCYCYFYSCYQITDGEL